MFKLFELGGLGGRAFCLAFAIAGLFRDLFYFKKKPPGSLNMKCNKEKFKLLYIFLMREGAV